MEIEFFNIHFTFNEMKYLPPHYETNFYIQKKKFSEKLISNFKHMGSNTFEFLSNIE